MRVLLWPAFDNPDKGEGGIRRVVEGQLRHMPSLGVEFVTDEASCDVVAIHGGVSPDSSLLRTKKPIVAHCHGLYWKEYEWGEWAHKLNRHVLEVTRRAAVVTAPSKWVSYVLKRGFWIEPEVIYHGLDIEDWTPGDKSNNYVLWNKTRPDPICDPTVISDLAQRMPHVRFVSTYGEATDNLKITGRLPHDEAKTVIQNASIYLCTTRETFGIGTLEAMASECVVAAWRWGGQAEILEEGKDGLFCNPYDMDSLVNIVEKGLAAVNDGNRMGVVARGKVKADFTWQRAAASYLDVYNRAIRSQPKVKTSVVITCYNLAEFLPRAVESVATQADEVIIVNDNSPDNTIEVATALTAAHPNVKLLTNEKNLYLAGALNAGIEKALGAYIIPLDADNELTPGAVELLSNILDAHNEVAISYGAMQVIEPDGTSFISGWPPQEFDYELQMKHRNQLPSTSMFRKSYWGRRVGYRRRCRTAEDADFWCGLSNIGALARKATDAPVLIYHNRTDSMSHVNADWGWNDWYAASRDEELTPFVVPTDFHPIIPSYEPALVTVIIPVGPGHDMYLMDAIDSLVAQSYVNWRCIVVNDSGVPLNVPSFVEVIESGARSPGHARNLGIAACKTPLFLPLDADDYLHPDALRVLTNAYRDGGEKKYYYTDWIIIQESGATEIIKAPDFNCEALRKRLIHTVTGLYPNVEWCRFDGDLDAWEDWDFALNLVDNGYCGIRIPIPLLFYRVHTGMRREEQYARRVELKENIATKWSKWLKEGQDMACGCSGGKTKWAGAVVPGAATQAGQVAAGQLNNSMVLVEFLGDGGARSYRGRTTGQVYRFGGDSGHKKNYVFGPDAQAFLAERPHEFKLAENIETISEVMLTATGPPVRV